MNKSIKKLLSDSCDPDDYRSGVPPSLKEINDAQQHLNIKFCIEYVKFIQEVGWLEIFNTYFFGVPKNGTPEGNVVRMTEFARKNWELPENFAVIYSSEDELLWCFDGNIENKEPPIVGYDTKKKKFTGKISTSFYQAIKEYIEG